MIANGTLPAIDLQAERAMQNVCLEAAETGLLASAHDCSDGGLAVALAECCFSSLNHEAVGADISLRESLPPTSMLFSESPSRIIISFPRSSRTAIEDIAEREKCPFTIIGYVGGTTLRIRIGEKDAISIDVSEMENAWRSSLSRKLKAEVMAAGRE
jgi:phosphoribosylformylglycinamidine (FGAM) synthase-like enzyme